MLYIYQVGDVPLYYYLVGAKSGITYTSDQRWETPEVRFTASGGTIYQGPVNRSIPQKMTGTVGGTAMARNSMLARELSSRLKSLGGRATVTLIGFRYEELDDPAQSPRLDWVAAEVIITALKDNFTYASSNGEDGSIFADISMAVAFMTPFRRLPKDFWEYRSHSLRNTYNYVPNGSASPTTSFYHPSRLSDIQDEFFFVRWQDQNTLLNPDYWGVAHTTDVSGQGSGFSESFRFYYNSQQALWGYTPHPIYAFTELLPYGSLKIRVQRSIGSWANDDYIEESTLDLAQLNQDLAAVGYGGLTLGDIVYTGDIYPFPGYVVRAGQILQNVVPRWVYSGLFPGELQTGAAFVEVVPYLTSGKVAYKLDYRTL